VIFLPSDEFHKQFEDPLYARRLAQLAEAQNLVLKSTVKLEQQFGGVTVNSILTTSKKKINLLN
jgi:hypothetical protein